MEEGLLQPCTRCCITERRPLWGGVVASATGWFIEDLPGVCKTVEAARAVARIRLPTADLPRMKKDTQTIIINFGDDATSWFREISEAVQEGPETINVQFVGGACPPAYETISLRNMLLQIPGHIKLTTTAACSLPPLTCAAWLVGDERRIAQDAVVWIPRMPTCLLGDGSHVAKQDQDSNGIQEDDEDAEDDEETPLGEPTVRPSGGGLGISRRGYILGPERLKTDLRILASAVNEWFPTWEFSGSSLTVEDLLEWNVIRPEWVFGGRSPRTRTVPSVPENAQASLAKKPEPKSPEGGSKPESQPETEPLPNPDAGGRSPGVQRKQ